MTEIPEPTEEDFELLPSLQARHADLWSSHCNSETAKLIRLLSHYQRENERLKAIISDHLKEQAEIYLADPLCPDEYQADAQRIIDALSGEGGAA